MQSFPHNPVQSNVGLQFHKTGNRLENSRFVPQCKKCIIRFAYIKLGRDDGSAVTKSACEPKNRGACMWEHVRQEVDVCGNMSVHDVVLLH